MFAYGQTGAGKSYTMLSVFEQTVSDLFLGMHSPDLYESLGLSLSVSFYEVYQGKVFDLFADRDPEPLLYQPLEVVVGGMNGHTAHRDVLAFVLAAFRQRDVESFRRSHSVIEEELVKVAHSIEQKRRGIVGFDLEILRHHRSDGCIGHGHDGSPRMS